MRYRALLATLLALCVGVLTACGGDVAVSQEALTYDQIRGSGLAVNCPQLPDTARGSFPLDVGQSYLLTDLCLEPTDYQVKEEPTSKRQSASFVPGKVLTRFTYSLTAIKGPLTFNDDRSLTFVEEDGIDFQAITVLLPGGEEVPFLFTVKELVATTNPGLESITTSTNFAGEFKVPSYRTSAFLDPKGRGLTSGYGHAAGLTASIGDQKELVGENVKRFVKGTGEISLEVAKVDGKTGEVAGIFESVQPSDTDMGSKEPVDVKIRGIFYGRIAPAA